VRRGKKATGLLGDGRGAERIGIDKTLGKLKVSGMIGTIVYVLVLIPVLIAFGVGPKEIAGREVEVWVKKMKGEK
jgi:hypothetical protein